MHWIKREIYLRCFIMKNTKSLHLHLKTLCSPCGTILPRAEDFTLNACALRRLAEAKISKQDLFWQILIYKSFRFKILVS